MAEVVQQILTEDEVRDIATAAAEAVLQKFGAYLREKCNRDNLRAIDVQRHIENFLGDRCGWYQ